MIAVLSAPWARASRIQCMHITHKRLTCDALHVTRTTTCTMHKACTNTHDLQSCSKSVVLSLTYSTHEAINITCTRKPFATLLVVHRLILPIKTMDCTMVFDHPSAFIYFLHPYCWRLMGSHYHSLSEVEGVCDVTIGTYWHIIAYVNVCICWKLLGKHVQEDFLWDVYISTHA